ncbi:MAG: Gfo/Idh/MocA family oxidoreductase [Puniceicoccales bacterium]|jgi:predicted dehydrogenase|nr:Gfo/Idh/MocA family oxidoreductase [Puniceicoccales bacterium]
MHNANTPSAGAAPVSRRNFLKTAGAAAGFLIIPSGWLRGQDAPSNRVNIAAVGFGNQGKTDIKGMKIGQATIRGLCDVDSKRLAEVCGMYPEAAPFEDYRVMLDKLQREVDAVVVSTGDHSHFTIALDAIQRGKHVYVQKPMAHSLDQVRRLSKAAADAKIVSSMGNQGHSSNHIRMVKEWREAGFFGEIQKVDCWDGQHMGAVQSFPKTRPVPANLNWDLWLGPAQYRDYIPGLHPGTWRNFHEFGSGSLGDMAAHIMDPAYYILDLDIPEKIEILELKETSPITYPGHAKMVFHFPANATRGPVKIVWWHGRNFRPVPPEGLHYQGNREDDENLPENPALNLHPGAVKNGGLVRRQKDGLTLNGSLFYGEKLAFNMGQYGDYFYTAPHEKFAELKAKAPPQKYGRFKGGHYKDFVNAIRNGKKAVSDFSYAGRLTQVICMGNIALRLRRTLNWSFAKEEFINDPEANALIKSPAPRAGFHA